MKPSEKKKQTVNELIQLGQEMEADLLYCWPRRKVVRDWLANTAVVLRNLDEGDYKKFTELSSVISPDEKDREVRKKAAYQIDGFIRTKVAEYKKYDFSYLDKGKISLGLFFIGILKWFGRNIEKVAIAIIIAALLAWLGLK